MPSIAAALRWADSLLQRAPTKDALRDSRFLLASALQADLAWLLAHPEFEVAEKEWGLFQESIYERAAGRAMAYIVGHREFYGRDFLVSPAVLIPRPETELLIDQGLKVLGMESLSRREPLGEAPGPATAGNGSGDPTTPSASRAELLLADIGTGSGCIAVTLAAEIPAAFVIATDVSESALQVARTNAARHGVLAQMELSRADLLPENIECFDAIFSNPPYVANGDPNVAEEVLRNEPATALFAGSRGTEFYERIVPLAGRRLKAGGWLLLELGYQSEATVRGLCDSGGWHNVEVVADLQGIARCLAAQRRPR